MAAIDSRAEPATGWLAVGATIFLSAFLLFLVQPLMAKLILPRFGGSATVWATCLVFFQAALLLGYAAADQLVRRHTKGLALLHIALLSGSLALLPIGVGRVDAPAGDPSLQVLLLLAGGIGLPFVLLAMTSPLLQAWMAGGARNPYRLFAISNLASLAALASYPWLLEPWLPVGAQALWWSAGYAGYVLLLGTMAALRWRRPAADDRSALPVQRRPDAGDAPRAGALASWIALAALASFQLVAVTNHLTQNVPSMPMMWVLPLVIYLVTFVLCFDNDRWYRPAGYASALVVSIAAMSWALLNRSIAHDLALQSLVFGPALFACCMFCHGELAASRPAPAHLSRFYLCVALGGAVGGALVALAAPLLLPANFEVESGLVLIAGALLWRGRARGAAWALAAALALLVALIASGQRVRTATENVVAMHRNFYGVVRVREYGSAAHPATHRRTLAHGGILHGEQYIAPDRRRRPTSYYTVSSGIGRLLGALQAQGTPAMQVGLVGLGTGTLATYGRAGDHYTFFEIDPAIVDTAREHFTFLGDSAAAVDVIVGDGRLRLQQQPVGRFDVLAIDAFSGDSIPAHLLTREALALYASRLRDNGVIALHVSNRYLNLKPVVRRTGEDLGLHLQYINDPERDNEPTHASSDWILLSKSRRTFDLPALRDHASPLPEADARHLWTDAFSNVARVIRTDRLFAF
jgi:SAM-dependent methyltransferase